MGDLVACEDPIHSFETDLETRGLFEHAGMLGQGGIGMAFELLEQLLFMRCRHRSVTACGFHPDMQSIVVVTFHIPFYGIDVDREVARRFFWCGSTQDQIDNPSP